MVAPFSDMAGHCGRRVKLCILLYHGFLVCQSVGELFLIQTPFFKFGPNFIREAQIPNILQYIHKRETEKFPLRELVVPSLEDDIPEDFITSAYRPALDEAIGKIIFELGYGDVFFLAALYLAV